MTADLSTKRIKWEDIVPLPDNPINEGRIGRILGNGGFAPYKVGTPEVCLNDAGAFPDLPDDALICADGNNRRELAIRAGKASDTVIVKIHKGLTRPEISKLFLGLNDYREHRANELFVRRVESRERKAVEINEIVTAAGWHVPTSSNNVVRGVIIATGALEWVYDGAPNVRVGGKKFATGQKVALTRAVETMAAIYGREPKVASGNLIKGLGLLFLRYGDKVDMGRLTERVSEGLPTPRKLFARAEVQREAWNCTQPESVARALRAQYNGSRRSKNDLAEW